MRQPSKQPSRSLRDIIATLQRPDIGPNFLPGLRPIKNFSGAFGTNSLRTKIFFGAKKKPKTENAAPRGGGGGMGAGSPPLPTARTSFPATLIGPAAHCRHSGSSEMGFRRGGFYIPLLNHAGPATGDGTHRPVPPHVPSSDTKMPMDVRVPPTNSVLAGFEPAINCSRTVHHATTWRPVWGRSTALCVVAAPFFFR